MNNNNCEKCSWFAPWKEGYGFCHGAPPKSGAEEMAPGSWKSANWPLTFKDDFCGSFKGKDEVERLKKLEERVKELDARTIGQMRFGNVAP